MSDPTTPSQRILYVPASSPYGSPEPISPLLEKKGAFSPEPASPSPSPVVLPMEPVSIPKPKFAVVIPKKDINPADYEIFPEKPAVLKFGKSSVETVATAEEGLGSSPPIGPIESIDDLDSSKEQLEEANDASDDSLNCITDPSPSKLPKQVRFAEDTIFQHAPPAAATPAPPLVTGTRAEADSSPSDSIAAPSSPIRDPTPASSVSTTPVVPAVKRRRLNVNPAANKLTKPFKSPLRLDVNPTASTSTASADGVEKYPPSTPPRKTSLSFKSILPPPTDPTTHTTAHPMSPTALPIKAQSTTKKRPLPGSAMKTPNHNPPFRSSFTKHKPLNLASSGSFTSTSGTKDPYLLSLEQKLSLLQSSIKEAKTQLDEASQALKIEQSGEDDKLEELVGKWKGAAQQAADEMFPTVENRVDKMGGVAAYKEMQRRRSGGGIGGFGGGPGGRGSGGGGGGGGWGFAEDPEEGMTDEQKEARRQAMWEAGMDEVSELEREETEVKDDALDGDHFTMEMMLKSLNIDLGVIGYDKNLQRWIN